MRFWPTRPAAPVRTIFASLEIMRCGPSQFEFLEDRFGNVLDDQHDQAPEPRQINDTLAPIDRAHDTCSDRIWLGPERPAFVRDARGHWRVDEAGLDRQHVDVRFRQALTQA